MNVQNESNGKFNYNYIAIKIISEKIASSLRDLRNSLKNVQCSSVQSTQLYSWNPTITVRQKVQVLNKLYVILCEFPKELILYRLFSPKGSSFCNTPLSQYG